MNWIELAHFGFFLATVLVSVYLLRCALVFLGILVVERVRYLCLHRRNHV